MEPTDWPSEHSGALRDLLGRQLSFSELAAVINKKFGTAYSRSAVIGRARRLRVVGNPRPDGFSVQNRISRLGDVCAAVPPSSWFRRPPPPPPENSPPLQLRCVEIDPRHLTLTELERGDCRYPYGGDEDGEAITFCGHPRRPDSSYCAPHFHLTRGPDAPPERAASTVVLRVVETT